MNHVVEYFKEFWEIASLMAPSLLLGFMLAGLLSVLLKPAWVARQLGSRGWSQLLKAALIGVPMPLCSCSVIPVTASIRKAGASKGATASFLASTPQTGVDSILPTWVLLGPVITFIKILAALVGGLLTGGLIEQFDSEDKPSTENDNKATKGSCCHSEEESAAPERSPLQIARDALSYGFIRLPDDLGSSLLLGLCLSAAITLLLPPDLLTGAMGSGFLAYIFVTLAAVPLYVCSTGSIPVALSLMAAGGSPGLALVFLIAGPATNIATVVMLRKMLGLQAMIFYLVSLLLTSWLFAWGLDSFLADSVSVGSSMHEHVEHLNWLNHLSAALLLGLCIVPKLRQWMTRANPHESTAESCCGDTPEVVEGSSCCGGEAGADAKKLADKQHSSCCSKHESSHG